MSGEPALLRTRACALIEREGRVLLVRDGGDPFFTLPGGSVEEGEFSDDALRRELREELGVEPATVGALRLVCENLFRWRARRYQEIVLLFEADLAAGDVPLRDGEFALCEPHLLFLWAGRDALDALDIRPSPVAGIVRAGRQRPAPILHRRLREEEF